MSIDDMRANLKDRFRTGVIVVAAMTAAYLVAAIIGAFSTGNSEFIFYIVVMVVLASGLLVVHTTLGLSTPLLAALSLWGAVHMAGGLIPVPEHWPINGDIHVLYSWWIIPAEGGGGYLKYDHVAHAYGFGIATWATWEVLVKVLRRHGSPRPQPTLGLLVLCFAAGCGFGALNEVVEFIATRITTTNVGGYENTGWDLISNAAGALVAVALIGVLNRQRQSA